MLQTAKSPRVPPRGKPTEPAWQIATLFPDQGVWDEGDYLALNTNHLVEFSDGHVEVLPMPKMSHQLMMHYLGNLLLAFAGGTLGTVVLAPFRIRLRKGKYREPDVSFMLTDHANRMGESFWEKADLVMEIVSDEPEDRERDLVAKRSEYAKAGIPEYWIVDPQERRGTVLSLKNKTYIVRGEHTHAGIAKCVLLKGFQVSLAALWATARLPGR
jgi:Uma2 family endonuclease